MHNRNNDMKERGILFSAPMVRALVEGRKTQTRRIVKLQTAPTEKRRNAGTGAEALTLCPYGRPGDRLWVKETWKCTVDSDWIHVSYRADGATRKINRTDLNDRQNAMALVWGSKTQEKFPALFMPRWASRITLEIVSVRRERLQEVTEQDAVAEGWLPDRSPFAYSKAYNWYRDLWDSINGLGSWNTDPWVWRVEFKKILA
jgi:hypothetical protein